MSDMYNLCQRDRKQTNNTIYARNFKNVAQESAQSIEQRLGQLRR